VGGRDIRRAVRLHLPELKRERSEVARLHDPHVDHCPTINNGLALAPANLGVPTRLTRVSRRRVA